MRHCPHHLILLAGAIVCIGVTGCGGASEGATGNRATSGGSASPRPPQSESTGRVAQADTSVDTFTGTAKTIVDWSGAIANVYGTYQAADALLQAFGILGDPSQDATIELKKLEVEVDQVAGNITWFIAEADREKELSDLLTSVAVTHDSVRSGQPVDWSSLNTATSTSVAGAADTTLFERYFVDSDTNGSAVSSAQAGSITWKNVVPYSQSDLLYDNGQVYDWRVGLPSFMQLIALRMQLIALQDPSFTTDGNFHDELTRYHDLLQGHLATMDSGIRCNTVENDPEVPSESNAANNPSFEFWVACADIHTGLNETQVLYFDDSYPLSYASCALASDGTSAPDYDQACLDRRATDYFNWYQTNVQAVQDAAYRTLRNQMPWFGVQAMIDTLYLYANGTTDLTRSDSTIHVAASPGLCVDVPSNSPMTQVQIWNCNGDPTSQSWQYDRTNQTVVNESSSLCLDVEEGVSLPGTAVWTYWCNGTPAQRWTYDAQAQVLRNMLGNALDVPWANLQPGQFLWTWPMNGGDAQRWQ